MIQLSVPPPYGTTVSVNAGALGIQTGTFLGTDTTSQYGYVSFTAGFVSELFLIVQSYYCLKLA